MKFKEWMLQEVGTSTSCVAGFSRITIPMVRRMWPTTWGNWCDDKKKKKPMEQPQVEESTDIFDPEFDMDELIKSDPRYGCVCPHCGSHETYGARAVERGQNGKWAYANAACRSCDNGFGFNFETNTPSKTIKT